MRLPSFRIGKPHRAALDPHGYERRWSGSITGPSGYGYADPSAIPPPGMRSYSIAGVPVTLQTALQVDAVRIAMRVISTNLVKLGNPRAFREQIWTDPSGDAVPYHQYLKTQPDILTETFDHGWQTVGVKQLAASFMLFGECAMYVLMRDDLGLPEVVKVLHPGWLQLKHDPGSDQPIWMYGRATQQVALNPANLVHYMFDPLPEGERGLNTIDYSKVSLAIFLAAQEYGQRYFSQGTQAGYFLTTTQATTQDETRRALESWMVNKAGLANSHMPVILPGDMKAVKAQATPDEAQYLNTLAQARLAIGSWYGIPPHLMGAVQERGNAFGPGAAEELSKQFVQHTLANYISALEEIYSKFLPRGVNAGYDVSKLTYPDAQSLAAEITAVRNTQTMSINDIRTRYRKMPPLPDDQANDPLAPLASNTAPEQTDNGAGPPNEPTPAEGN